MKKWYLPLSIASYALAAVSTVLCILGLWRKLYVLAGVTGGLLLCLGYLGLWLLYRGLYVHLYDRVRLAYEDGAHDLAAIAERAGVSIRAVCSVIDRAKSKGEIWEVILPIDWKKQYK